MKITGILFFARLVFMAVIYFFSLPASAQAPLKQWDKTIGGNQSDFLRCMQKTADGGYILGGWSSSGISGDKTQAAKGGRDFWIVKTDSTGNFQWDKSFGGTGEDDFTSLQQTSDGGFILGGYSNTMNNGDKTSISKGLEDYWIVKINANGIKQWDKCFGGE